MYKLSPMINEKAKKKKKKINQKLNFLTQVNTNILRKGNVG